jgi:biotin-dependent carboxylase-like uncharacterized protein
VSRVTARSLTVLAPGPFTTVQDLGRPGLARWGVGRSGAADRGAAALANRLVANPEGAAVLELTMGGLVVRADAALTVALTGAETDGLLEQAGVPFGSPLAMAAGSVLRLGSPVVGLRTYLAVRGGVDVPPVLGSRSYDLLARLGPPPLRAGDVLPVAADPKGWPKVDLAPPGVPASRPVRLTGRAGPHLDAVEPASARQLADAVWSVSADSDRSGLRLDGSPLARRRVGEWPPEGLVRGAIQLPPSGQPVVMLADHPVTGGYPAIGALDDGSCDRAAQLRPGDWVRLLLG